MKVYVNLAFLENLFLSEEETDRHFYIKRLLRSSQSAIEIIVDVDIEDVYKDPEKRILYRKIAQNISKSDSSFLIACQEQRFHETGEPKLFFIDGIPLAINQEFGCFQASTDCLEDADFLFYDEEIRIDKNQRDWSSLKNIKHPCNALVVTDNYLFSDKDIYLENINQFAKTSCLLRWQKDSSST